MTLLPLVLNDVAFEVNGHAIISELSVTVGKGTRTVVMGANGAGKSVFLRLCHGLLTPTAGTIRWNIPESIDAPRRQAMVFQRPVLLRRSAIDNVVYALKLAGVARGDRLSMAHEALARVGLATMSARSARVMSGGEQQRLALARAWALNPEVIFLDEPTASLDPAATHEIEHYINAMHEAGSKVVLVTHNLGQARRLGDEILFLHRGQLVEHADAHVFFRHPVSTAAAQFLEGELPW